MRLNHKKTKIFVTNFTINHQFESLITIPGQNKPVERILETKLLGYWFTQDMKPATHVDYIVSICYKKMWGIRKLKRAGIKTDDIVFFYNMKLRAILERSCFVFYSTLTIED